MKSLTARRRATGHAEAANWKAHHDALLSVLNAILLAYGQGPQGRVAVARSVYEGRRRRNVAVESLGDRIVVYLEPVIEEEQSHDRRDH